MTDAPPPLLRPKKKKNNSTDLFTRRSLAQHGCAALVFNKDVEWAAKPGTRARSPAEEQQRVLKVSLSIECNDYPIEVALRPGEPAQVWPTALHLFQARRFLNLSLQPLPAPIRFKSTPGQQLDSLAFLANPEFLEMIRLSPTKSLRTSTFSVSTLVQYFQRQGVLPAGSVSPLPGRLTALFKAWEEGPAQVEILQGALWDAYTNEATQRRAALLLQTGDALLGQRLTHNTGDPWSVSTDGTQAGLLGDALMAVRTRLRLARLPPALQHCCVCKTRAAACQCSSCQAVCCLMPDCQEAHRTAHLMPPPTRSTTPLMFKLRNSSSGVPRPADPMDVSD